MLLNRIKKITGVMRVRILIPDFETKEFNQEYIYSGGICLDLTDGKYICTNYIPGVIDAEFYTYKELGLKLIKEKTLELVEWSGAHKLHIGRKSKQWDYINFIIENIDTCQNNLISFPKINKIAGIFSLDKKYSIYGSTNKKININKSIKTNLIHDLLPNQIFYLGDQSESYSGSLVYTICEKSGTFFLEILGFTSNDYDESSRIVPIEYCEYFDCIINTNTISYTPDLKNIIEIPIVKATRYPQFTKNYLTSIKKDDIIITIDGKNIINMEIYSSVYNQKLYLDEYITYQKQYQNQTSCLFVIIRKSKIIEVTVELKIFEIQLVNQIYLDINDLYVSENDIKFSSDICDALLQYDIFDKQILKYMNDITYSIEKISV